MHSNSPAHDLRCAQHLGMQLGQVIEQGLHPDNLILDSRQQLFAELRRAAWVCGYEEAETEGAKTSLRSDGLSYEI